MKKTYALIPIAMVLLLAGCSSSKEGAQAKETAAKPDPIEVRVAVAKTETVERTLDVTGSLMADETVSASSEVAGRIASIPVDFGQSVKKGQVVAQLDTREFEIQLQRSNAALAQALARIGLNPDQANERPTTTPAIRQASAQYDDALSKFDNAKKLFETGDIARERYTELEKTLAARKAALDAAEDDLRTQLANIDALQADKALVEKRIRDATVRAPFDGFVKEKMISEGQYTKDNTPILTLVKTSPLRLRVDVPETAAGAVSVGDTLRFTTDAIPGRTFTAVIRELNPALDARSRSLTSEARISSGDPRLRPGMFVHVQLVVDRQAQIVVVPQDAVYTMAGLTKVFTVQGNLAREHIIAPGPATNGWVEVPAETIHAGDQVVIEKVASLSEGAEVAPRL